MILDIYGTVITVQLDKKWQKYLIPKNMPLIFDIILGIKEIHNKRKLDAKNWYLVFSIELEEFLKTFLFYNESIFNWHRFY